MLGLYSHWKSLSMGFLCKVLELLSTLLFLCSSAGRIFVPGMMCSRGFVGEKM